MSTRADDFDRWIRTSFVEMNTQLEELYFAQSELDELLELAPTYSDAPWFQQNARLFLEVCDLFGRSAAQHHDGLVKRFIEEPAGGLAEQDLQGITASGPPLPVLIRSLEVLRDLRLARRRGDLGTRYDDLARLRSMVKDPSSCTRGRR